MKNRDDFINSVWEKSEKAMTEERARKGRRRQAGGLAACAACLALVIGITSGGGPAELLGDLLGGASSDEAFNEGVVMYDAESQDAYDVKDAATSSDDGSEVPVSPSCAGDTAVSLDGAPTGALQMSDADLYGVLREETEAAEKSKDSDIIGYFCLPIGVQIEDNNGSLLINTDAAGNEEKCEELLLKYMKWFYSLPEDQVLTTEEFENLNEIPTGFYKFTMDFSLGADTEGVDRVFWLVGEVTLP